MSGSHLKHFGKNPGGDFSEQDNPYYGVRVGIITRVDEFNLKCDIKMLTGGDRYEVDLTQALAGPRSFLGGIPEVNSLVLVGYRRRGKSLYDAMILGYVPVGTKSGLRFDPYTSVGPDEISGDDKEAYNRLIGNAVRYKRILGKPGDIMGMSSSGAEMLLSKDVQFYNRAGDTFELRDYDRTLLQQSIHRVESDSAAQVLSGPIRRGAMDLPIEVFQKDGRTLKTEAERYFGRDELQGVKPEAYANSAGKVIDRLNSDEFPPTTYSTGRRYYYAGTTPASNFEDATNGGSGRVFTERRVEMRHDTDLQQEVLGEIDGFQMERRINFIEQVFGTLVGNDAFSTQGMRQYGRVLKPRLFSDFNDGARGRFQLQEAVRLPGTPDESYSKAAGYYFKLQPPRSPKDNAFVVAVSKQGKLYCNIPGSTEEDYSQRNVSAEVSMEGALKMFLGAAKPDNVSLHLTCEGGIVAEIGHGKSGAAIDVKYRSAVKTEYSGNADDDGNASSTTIQGNRQEAISGNDTQIVNGSYLKKVSGGYQVSATRVSLNAMTGYTLNAGELNQLVSGKSQFNYALQVMETIVAGGRVSTVLAGGVTNTISAGAFTQNVLAGASTFNNPGGAYSVTVGVGTLSLTTGAGAVTMSTGAGAMTLSAAGGAMALTAGLAINLTSPVMVALNSPQVALGAAVAPFGVARGTPMHPPGSPSLDWLTGLPLQGSANIRSI